MLWTAEGSMYCENSQYYPVTLNSEFLYFNKYKLTAGNTSNSYVKNTPYFCQWLGLGLLWSVLVRGALLALGLLCWSLLVVKPAKR